MALSNFAQRFPFLYPSFRQILGGGEKILVASVGRPLACWTVITALRKDCNVCTPISLEHHARRHFHSNQSLHAGTKREILSRGEMAASMPKVDEGTEGEKILDLNLSE